MSGAYTGIPEGNSGGITPHDGQTVTDPDALVLELAMIAFNLLRMIGQESLKHKQPIKRKVRRRRLRTVIEESDALRQPFYEACTSYDYGSGVQQYLASRLLGRLETVCPHIVR